MSKFCSKECKDIGSICDFCTNYRDEYRDIRKMKDKFAGDGICSIDKSKVFASDGYGCDNFVCFKINKSQEKDI